MYCPKCGNRQASEDIRFCAKCGLPLEHVTKLVTAGSAPAVAEKNPRRGQLSPRAKGVLQGVAIVPASIGAWLILDIIYETAFGAGMLGGLYAMFTLILLVSLARILYAILHEEGSAHRRIESPLPNGAQGAVGAGPTSELLPGPRVELAQPLSVTEKTTRRFGPHS